MPNWVDACATDEIDAEDVFRFDHDGRSFAVYRSPDDTFFATDGWCTHEQAHLADGLVMDNIIECPKHNGRFRLSDGSPARAPVCRGLAVYPLEERAGRLWLNIARAGGCGARQPRTLRFNIQIGCDEF